MDLTVLDPDLILKANSDKWSDGTALPGRDKGPMITVR
jgi:hypothetical protein